jgi:hypothetical protein
MKVAGGDSERKRAQDTRCKKTAQQRLGYESYVVLSKRRAKLCGCVPARSSNGHAQRQRDKEMVCRRRAGSRKKKRPQKAPSHQHSCRAR